MKLNVIILSAVYWSAFLIIFFLKIVFRAYDTPLWMIIGSSFIGYFISLFILFCFYKFFGSD